MSSRSYNRIDVRDIWKENSRSCKIRFDYQLKQYLLNSARFLSSQRQRDFAEIDALFQELYKSWKADIERYDLKHVPTNLLNGAVNMALRHLRDIAQKLFDHFDPSPSNYNTNKFSDSLSQISRLIQIERDALNDEVNKFLEPFERAKSIRFQKFF